MYINCGAERTEAVDSSPKYRASSPNDDSEIHQVFYLLVFNDDGEVTHQPADFLKNFLVCHCT